MVLATSREEAASIGAQAPDPDSGPGTALEQIGAGAPIVLAERRTGVGHLFVAADLAGPDVLNFMAKRGRGIVCLCLTAARCGQLGLAPLGGHDPGDARTSLTASIEARHGVSTGISVADRARTIAVAIAKGASAEDIVVPGHVFPLQAFDGGVLARASYVEAAVDLASLAGREPAGVVCQILSDDGADAGPADLLRLARETGMALVWVEDLIAHRGRREPLVERLGGERAVVTAMGVFALTCFREPFGSRRYYALTLGEPGAEPEALVRSRLDGAGDPLDFLELERVGGVGQALREIAARGAGVLVYAGGGGEGPFPLDDAELQRALVAQIVAELGIERFRLRSS